MLAVYGYFSWWYNCYRCFTNGGLAANAHPHAHTCCGFFSNSHIIPLEINQQAEHPRRTDPKMQIPVLAHVSGHSIHGIPEIDWLLSLLRSLKEVALEQWRGFPDMIQSTLAICHLACSMQCKLLKSNMLWHKIELQRSVKHSASNSHHPAHHVWRIRAGLQNVRIVRKVVCHLLQLTQGRIHPVPVHSRSLAALKHPQQLKTRDHVGECEVIRSSSPHEASLCQLSLLCCIQFLPGIGGFFHGCFPNNSVLLQQQGGITNKVL